MCPEVSGYTLHRLVQPLLGEGLELRWTWRLFSPQSVAQVVLVSRARASEVPSDVTAGRSCWFLPSMSRTAATSRLNTAQAAQPTAAFLVYYQVQPVLRSSRSGQESSMGDPCRHVCCARLVILLRSH